MAAAVKGVVQAEALESASESVSTHRKQRAITQYDREEVPYGSVLHSEREIYGASRVPLLRVVVGWGP